MVQSRPRLQVYNRVQTVSIQCQWLMAKIIVVVDEQKWPIQIKCYVIECMQTRLPEAWPILECKPFYRFNRQNRPTVLSTEIGSNWLFGRWVGISSNGVQDVWREGIWNGVRRTFVGTHFIFEGVGTYYSMISSLLLFVVVSRYHSSWMMRDWHTTWKQGTEEQVQQHKAYDSVFDRKILTHQDWRYWFDIIWCPISFVILTLR